MSSQALKPASDLNSARRKALKLTNNHIQPDGNDPRKTVVLKLMADFAS